MTNKFTYLNFLKYIAKITISRVKRQTIIRQNSYNFYDKVVKKQLQFQQSKRKIGKGYEQSEEKEIQITRMYEKMFNITHSYNK